MENTSKVNIFLRIRPPNIWETSSPMKTYIDYDKSTKKMFILENQPYIFDKIFYSNSNNKEIFYNLESNVDHLLNGYNNCILAYGQSGAGKTYTMGFNEKDEKSLGLISLSLDTLFQKIKEKHESVTNDGEYSVSVSYIEIYNEKVYDLLSEKSSESIHTKGTKYAGSTKVPIKNSSEAKQLLLKGNKNRHVRSTLMNAASSRSHAMFTIMLALKTNNSERSSVLHLVDLAGSEGLRKTNHSGIAQQEGVHINQGLLAVCKVVQALSSGKNLVPYRDSILTTVLQDCLNLESFFTLIACISPARKNRSETLSSIRFAQSCKNLENKMLPEMNEFLKEKQRLEARTPLKPYMLPTTKNDKAKTPGRISSLKPPLSTIKKPGVANRCTSFITPSAKKAHVSKSRYTDLGDLADLSNFNQFTTKELIAGPKESLMAPKESLIGHKDSLMAPKESIDNNTFNIMNMSCSTEVEGITPSVSRFGSTTNLANLQAAPVMSFSPLMRRIEETIDKKLSTFMESFRNQTAADINSTAIVHQQMKEAVMNGIEEVRKSLDNSVFEVTTDPVSSTISRKSSSPQNVTLARRTNRRLMTVELINDSPIKSPEENKENEVQVFTATSPDENKTVIRPTRRSTRILDMRNVIQNKTVKVEEKVPRLAKRQVVKNKIVASYYGQSTENVTKVTKNDHKAAIMEMLNTGSVKDLQLLPTIGAKTAYQIVSYRMVKGKYKTLNDVKKALSMKDKAWEKFLEKNLLK
ncbi:kinesin-like protein Nod [Chironomus tepperi]|uniref:kinesin-like protein Nod n=1 Tax=Chironomus tepperi TaxID=113505 RepID=UPI00391F59F8